VTVTVVAIDGPSGAGKSTVARRVAAAVGWEYIDTGAMYRAIGLKADRLGIAHDDDPGLEALCHETQISLRRLPDGSLRVVLDGEDVTETIREHRVSELASRVSARLPVREAMTRFQRRLGEAAPSVLEGRDIGTIVFPDALVKIFLTASVEERARRRAEELTRRGEQVAYEDVLADVRQRDTNDSSREYAPLRPAPGSLWIDTTQMTIEEAVREVIRAVGAAVEAAKGQ
jgi:cytidylate kinase